MKTLTKIGHSPKSMVETLEKVSKTSIYLLVFLLPILFLPWTANVLEFNKQALLIILVFVSIFAWMLKILISGKASFNFSLIHLPIGILFLVYLASTIFSLWRFGSFWGWPQNTSESLLSLLGLVLFYFLLVNIFEKKESFYLIVSLIVSSSLAMLYGLLQLFGKFIMPIGFTKAASFNTIGGVNSLAVFAAILLPLIITFLVIIKQKYLRALFIGTIILSAIILLAINFQVAWWIVVIGSGLIIVFGLPRRQAGAQKRDLFDSRWLILPMFFLAIALLFIFFRFQIPQLSGTERPIEVFLTHRASWDIAWESFKESPLIGSGPGSFVYNFSRYKDISFNQSALWNIRFDWASSKALTILATVGALGVISFLGLIAFFVFYGIKFLFAKKKEEEEDHQLYWTLGLGVFISFLTATAGYFLYRSNLSLDFVYFLLMGCFVSLLYQVKKEVVLKPSSLITLGFTFSFTLIFIFSLGILILEGQRYASAISYLDGLKSWQKGETVDTIRNLEKAVRVSPKNDLYWREISQVYLQAVKETMERTDLSQAEATRQVQIYINSAVNSAKACTETNPKNVANWSVNGFVYQNLIGIVGGTKDWAVTAYQEALKLEPINPFYPTQAGISILKEASRLAEDKKEEKAKLLAQAQKELEKAIELKPDYASAHFQLAMVYQLQGKVVEMTEALEKAKASAPFDVGLAFQLGLIYFQTRDYEKAKLELERAVLLNSDYANALYFLGLSYDQLGEKDKAIQVFEKLRVNNPDHSLVIAILKNLKAGKGALEGIIEQEPPVVPIEEE